MEFTFCILPRIAYRDVEVVRCYDRLNECRWGQTYNKRKESGRNICTTLYFHLQRITRDVLIIIGTAYRYIDWSATSSPSMQGNQQTHINPHTLQKSTYWQWKLIDFVLSQIGRESDDSQSIMIRKGHIEHLKWSLESEYIVFFEIVEEAYVSSEFTQFSSFLSSFSR